MVIRREGLFLLLFRDWKKSGLHNIGARRWRGMGEKECVVIPRFGDIFEKMFPERGIEEKVAQRIPRFGVERGILSGNYFWYPGRKIC